ncbi:SOS response-associated peptidase [Roseivirga sp. BDSF3-8]|uniref:SOS response-associated peptidase n=1 Tax=Roseivirga sp. BDSF3-8 TaxID=3241598 RepID=UPI003531CD4A
MCGRYSISKIQKTVEKALKESLGATFTFEFEPVYNAAPSMNLPVIANETPKDIVSYRWGLIPFWAKDEKIGYKMINARRETILEKPAFKTAAKKKRCLVLADGYYEWQKLGDKKTKQPYRIFPTDQELFAFAGIWDEWHDKHTGEVVRSFSIITTQPPKNIAHIHDRMPVILEAGHREAWLSDGLNDDDIQALLDGYDGKRMDYYPVSTEVNSPRKNNESVIEPVNTQQGSQGSLF